MLWLKKLEVLVFGGLGGVLISSVAIERICFSNEQFNIGKRLTAKSGPNQVNGKGTFDVLGETSNNSLATEKCFFQQLSEQCKKGINHQKQAKRRWGKSGFGGLGESSDISLATRRTGFWRLKGFFGDTTIH